jgi:hypothetical protein
VPWFVYLITSVEGGAASKSQVWRMSEDHSHMVEESLDILEGDT